MYPHNKLITEALSAIRKVFEDTSVVKSTVRRSLEMLREEIDIMLENLKYGKDE